MSSFCICKSYSHFFSKNTCELDIVLIRTVNILTTTELVKLMILWTTGPRLCKCAGWFESSLGTHVQRNCFCCCGSWVVLLTLFIVILRTDNLLYNFIILLYHNVTITLVFNKFYCWSPCFWLVWEFFYFFCQKYLSVVYNWSVYDKVSCPYV